MQAIADIVFFVSLISVLASIVMSLNLLYFWSRRDNRMMTDLPFVFGLVFFLQSISILMTVLMPEMPLDIFRIRALIILGIVELLLYLTLFIWGSRYKRRHPYIILLVAIYWTSITLLAPSAEMIMTFCIPILLIAFTGMLVTFLVTWKTGRLQEVRSDLLVVSLAMILIAQAVTVSLDALGLDYIPDILVAISAIILSIGIYNPWKPKHEKSAEDIDMPLAE
ncbi:MAG: hypothetical protein ACTSUO_02440 [Candidatus Thorarchaeota archaeon]